MNRREILKGVSAASALAVVPLPALAFGKTPSELIKAKMSDLVYWSLFEFNDEQNRTMILRDMKAFLQPMKDRAIIYDFMVVCDETNNSLEVIDRNSLVLDVYYKHKHGSPHSYISCTNERYTIRAEEAFGIF